MAYSLSIKQPTTHLASAMSSHPPYYVRVATSTSDTCHWYVICHTTRTDHLPIIHPSDYIC